MAGRLGGLRIGTAGFSGVSGHWAGAGVFPPGAKGKSDAQLDFFQEAFDVCEVNGTCHGMPSEAQIAGWRVRCAPRFELALKVHHAVTHPQPGAAPAHAVDTFLTFLRRAAGLGPHLGPLLLQFPRAFAPSPDSRTKLEALGAALDDSPIPRARIALEVRHPGWLEDDDSFFLDFLRRRRWALVQHPNSLGRATTVREERGGGEAQSYAVEPLRSDWPITGGDWTYVRLHGYNDEHTCRYTDADLDTIGADLHRLYRSSGVSVFAFLLNDDARGAMASNARTLKRLTHAQAGEEVPRAPKQARGIASFFAPKAASRADDADGGGGGNPGKRPRVK
jgi:uncharacterized protein YecE (DUF72 family)